MPLLVHVSVVINCSSCSRLNVVWVGLHVFLLLRILYRRMHVGRVGLQQQGKHIGTQWSMRTGRVNGTKVS